VRRLSFGRAGCSARATASPKRRPPLCRLARSRAAESATSELGADNNKSGKIITAKRHLGRAVGACQPRRAGPSWPLASGCRRPKKTTVSDQITAGERRAWTRRDERQGAPRPLEFGRPTSRHSVWPAASCPKGAALFASAGAQRSLTINCRLVSARLEVGKFVIAAPPPLTPPPCHRRHSLALGP